MTLLALLLLATSIASLVVGVSPVSAGPTPPPIGHRQIICFHGKRGQPNGCRTFVVGGLVAS